ncbi:hypothetical protein ACHAO9_002922 [Fusarium lateritium]
MGQLSSLPSYQRASSPLLEEATYMLLCGVHKPGNLDEQLGRARAVLGGIARDDEIEKEQQLCNPISISECGPKSSPDGLSASDEEAYKQASAMSAWETYNAKWKSLCEHGTKANATLETQIPWPVCSGRLGDVRKGNVRAFFNDVAKYVVDEANVCETLSREQSRWSANKMQDIFGPSITGGVYNTVKEVRRIVDECYEKHQ